MLRVSFSFALRTVRLISQPLFSAGVENCSNFARRFIHDIPRTRRGYKGIVAIKQTLDSHAKGKITDQQSRVAALKQVAQIASANEQDRQELLGDKFQVHFENLVDDIGLGIRESRRQELAVILWSLGRIRTRQPWLFQECEKRLLELNVKQFSDTQICMIAWGFAQAAQKKPKKLFERIRVEVLRRGVQSLEDSKLCMLLRAFADPQLKDNNLFMLFEHEIMLRGFSVSSEVLLAQYVLSFARVECGTFPLFNGVANELIRRDLSVLTNRALADTLWSYSKAQVKHYKLVEQIQQELIARSLNKFETTNLAKICWALAKQTAQPLNATIFESVEAELLRRDSSRMGEGDIVQILWSFAQTGQGTGAIFQFFDKELTKRDFQNSPRNHVYLIAWSFAKRHPQAIDLLEKIFKVVDSWGSRFGRRERLDLKAIKTKLLSATK